MFDDTKKEITATIDSDLKRKVVPVEDVMSDGEIWELNLMLGYGNDIY